MDARDDTHDEDDAPALRSLLRWYAAMGVDAAVDDAPHDRFVAPAPASPRPRAVPAGHAAARPGPPPAGGAPQAAEALVAQAEALAAGATDLDALLTEWAAVPGCTLGAASRMIAFEGQPGAPLLVMGGTPGEDDERSGALFAGPTGRLLDAMLRAIAMDRDAAVLAHVVPWRPPGNRTPTALELALSLPFARRLIALARPRILLCLGERAAQPLLGSREPLSRLRSRWIDYEGDGETVKALVSYAPDFLLKQPLQKRRAWTDLQMVEAELEALRRRGP